MNTQPLSKTPQELETSTYQIGLFLPNSQVPQWVVEMVKDLQALPHVSGCTWITPSLSGASLKGWRRWYQGLDQRIFAYSPNAYRTRNLGELASPAETLILDMDPAKGVPSQASLDKLAELNLDIIFYADESHVLPGLAPRTRLGVWQLVLGDPARYGERLQGLEELLAQRPETQTSLILHPSAGGPPKVIFQSPSATHHSSLHRSRNTGIWKALRFLPRALQHIHTQGEDAFLTGLEALPGESTSPSSLLQLIPKVLGHGIRVGGNAFRKLRKKPQWYLRYALSPERHTHLPDFLPMYPPSDTDWADPFVVFEEGKYHIFIEELLHATHRGHLSVITMETNGQYSEPIKIIQEPYHLSYPFVFKEGDTWYMIPESAGGGCIRLYRAEGFPYVWTHEMNLMEEAFAYDTTLIEHEGRWWLFANMRETDGASSSEELFLFYADHWKTREWTPHPMNPIVSDVKRARPAGKIFRQDGKLYRPAQDCAKAYGWGFHFCEIQQLTPTQYKEVIARSFEPGWTAEVECTHTFNYDQGLSVIDAIRKIPK